MVLGLVRTGGPELIIKSDGAVLMGPGTKTNFNLARNGNLTIKGTLNQQSDRDSKTDFASIDVQKILDKVVELPITTWQYKDDKSSVRHIGPTSQDFKDAFAVGSSDKTISAIDADGVALASIQAMHKMLVEKDAQIKALSERLEDFELRMLELEVTASK